jgi:hypothetical protein
MSVYMKVSLMRDGKLCLLIESYKRFGRTIYFRTSAEIVSVLNLYRFHCIASI